MFKGIVETTGKLKKIEKGSKKTFFYIEVNNFLRGVKIGDSISCDGVCLTVIKKDRNIFTVELMPETLRLTRFGDVGVGDLINLEKAMKLNSRIDGHFVMGHVDAVGRIDDVIEEGKYTDLVIKVPVKLIKYTPFKGSIGINGVSLTIAKSGKDWVKVCLITHTLEITNFSKLKKGDLVNLEIDMIARYLEQLIKKK
ncbi:riboflavin synthase [bacterium]|nr:riboflavin synthase [bacterium]